MSEKPCPSCGRDMGHGAGLGLCGACLMRQHFKLIADRAHAVTRDEAKQRLTIKVMREIENSSLDYPIMIDRILTALYGPPVETPTPEA